MKQTKLVRSAPTSSAILGFLLILAGCSIQNDGQAAAASKSAGEERVGALSSRITSTRLALTEQSAELASKHALVPVGTESLLVTGRALRVGEHVWNDDGVPPGDHVIWIDLQRQLGSVFRGGHEIGISVILYGGDDHETPAGQFAIMYKDRDYHSHTYDAPMPYAMFVTSDGVAIHGSPMTTGGATHGCVGLPEDFARLVFASAKVGDKVTIVRTNQRSTSELSKQYFRT